MRAAIRFALLSSLLLPAAAAAQDEPGPARPTSGYKIEIQYVRVGFPPGPIDNSDENAPGQRESLYKMGAWTPVYIRLANVHRYDPDPKKDGPAVVIVSTPDCDDTSTEYAVPVPAFDEEEGLAGMANIVAYTRTGEAYGDFTIRVVAGNKDLAQDFKLGQRRGPYQSANGLDPSQGLYLALGSRLSGLHGPNKGEQPQNQQGNLGILERKSAVALLTRISELPPVWFGYNSADLVILATSERNFALSLVNDRVRAAALAEWVRRRGRLLVCAGANADVLAGSAELNAMLPIDIGKPVKSPSFNITWRDGGTMADALPAVTLTGLTPRDKPARGHRVLVDGPQGTGPVVVQGPYGLGRVTVVALDPDKPPVSKWSGSADFWQRLLAAAGPQIPESAANINRNVIMYPGNPGMRGSGGPTDTQQSELNGHLESFEGVPVISFGWVALFILLYILVVGPLDYLFLKKVVKRLELTWITFPTIVLVVSAAAYFTAYHLKGDELRINKLDVVDIDQQTGRAYGRTWFAVFSPRIQKYTIGVEPAAPWAGPSDSTDPATTVSWFGSSRPGRESILGRSYYNYAPRAAGLRGVPIQVWSLKGFQADWAAPLEGDKPPIENRLRHPPGRPDDLIGSITSRLPVDLEDAILIYRGEVASLGSLLKDTPKTVTAQGRIKFSQMRESMVETAANDRLQLLFHEACVGGPQSSNGSLRDLDQSWRLTDDDRDEVIIVGRLSQIRGTAEDVTKGPGSPSRLWMDKLPGEASERPPLRGTMRQDTLVRIFLPLTPER
jgi:hypothetical protein